MTTTLPPQQFTTVNGHGLAHGEMGQGEPIVQFLPWSMSVTAGSPLK